MTSDGTTEGAVESAAKPPIDTAEIDILRVMEMVPHRYPMLLIDRVIDVRKDVSATGIKCVTINEAFFQGHFPTRPIMPGVMIVEAMAQTAGVLVVETLGEEGMGKLVYFMSIEKAQFRRIVSPGDRLEIYVEKRANRRNVWKFDAKVRVDGKLAAEASFSAMLVDK